MLVDWLNNGTSLYFATLTGDGEYKLRDVLVGINLLRQGTFGVVYGSRTQSRRQFISSLRSAYGEGSLMYAVSWLGAFVATALFSLRFQVIFSDPPDGVPHLSAQPARRIRGPGAPAIVGQRCLNDPVADPIESRDC